MEAALQFTKQPAGEQSLVAAVWQWLWMAAGLGLGLEEESISWPPLLQRGCRAARVQQDTRKGQAVHNAVLHVVEISGWFYPKRAVPCHVPPQFVRREQ